MVGAQLQDLSDGEKTIVFLVAGHPGLGGTQEYAFMLAKKTLPLCRVCLVMPFDREQERQFGQPFKALGGEIIRLPESIWIRLCSRGYAKRLVGGYQLKQLLRARARAEGCEHVIVHSSLSPVATFFSARWAAQHGASVTAFHDFGRIERKSVSFWLNTLLLNLLPNDTAAFVVPSRDVKDKLLRFVANVREDRVNIINTGIDPIAVIARAEAARSDNPTFFMVGRVAEAKAPLVWLDAIRSHVANGGRGRFIWVGSGPLLDQCRQYIERHNLVARITFTGYLEDVTEAIQGADVLLFSSIWEGGCLPRGVLEAVFQGFPCVLPRLPPLVESLGEDNGRACFYEAGNAGSLTRAIGAIMRDFESLPGMAARARSHALKRHTAQNEFEQTLELYRRLLANDNR